MTDELPEHLPEIHFTPPAPGEKFFGNGRPSDHPHAVMYVGEYETLWDGTAVAVRSHARALAQTGIPVLLRSFTGTVVDEHGIARPAHSVTKDPIVEREVGALELTTADSYFPRVLHLVVRDAEHLKRVIIPQGAVAKNFEEQVRMRQHLYESTIVYSVWERDRIDPAIAKILSKVADNWVPCWRNAQMLIASGVPEEKVSVIPHPFDPADPILKLQRRKPDTTWKKFYSIGRWEPRKGYAELVEAFLRAFTPEDRAILTIKYTGGNWPGYASPEETMATALNDVPRRPFSRWTPEKIRERVKLIEGRLPRQAILELHYRNNIYVSASHGEAWNLPAFEACLAGNQVVYVPSGGVEDFVGNGHVSVTPGYTVPVPKSYGWEADAEWMDYSIAHLSYALQKATPPTTHDVALTKGIELRSYSLDAVGKLMRHHVLEVAAKRSAAALYYVDQCKEKETT